MQHLAEVIDAVLALAEGADLGGRVGLADVLKQEAAFSAASGESYDRDACYAALLQIAAIRKEGSFRAKEGAWRMRDILAVRTANLRPSLVRPAVTAVTAAMAQDAPTA
jgi:hypothetical protein